MTDSANAARVGQLFEQAEQAGRAGRDAEFVACLNNVLKIAPEHPRALNMLGNRLLSSGDAAGARRMFERAVAQDRQAPPIWLNLAFAARAMGDSATELSALDQALAVDPYFVVALLEKAQWFERHGRKSDAVLAYRALIDAAPAFETLPQRIAAALQHGKALVDAEDGAIEAAIRRELAGRPITSSRFDHALEVLGGRRQIYHPKPAGLHFPYLPPVQYFDRAQFPWFEKLEAGTDTIREELRGLLEGSDPNVPYVNIAPGTPENQWRELNRSLNWGAIFLWNGGAAVPAMLDRCPKTAKLLDELPLLDIAGRGPTVMFSTLKPHTRIPPHHGVTNIRAVVHLPLIVPPGCRFRVGSETREWREGEAWAFDDTIEHEAWNDSDDTRVIMIIDVWNPFLDEDERALLRTTNQVLSRLGEHLT